MVGSAMTDRQIPPLVTGPAPPIIPQTPPVLCPPIDRSRLVWFYRCWCGLFVIIYSAFAAYGILLAIGKVQPDLGLIESAVSRNDPKLRHEIMAEKRAEAPEVAAFAIGVAVFYGSAACIPRRPWAWTFGLVVICTTVMPLIITIAGMIPLLIQWASPSAKQHFGKRP